LFDTHGECPYRDCCKDMGYCPVHNVNFCNHQNSHSNGGRFKCASSNYHTFCFPTADQLAIEKKKLFFPLSPPCEFCGAMKVCTICNTHDCEPCQCPDRDDCIYKKCDECSGSGCFNTSSPHKTHSCNDSKVCPKRADCSTESCSFCNEVICTTLGSDHFCHFSPCSSCKSEICTRSYAIPGHYQKCSSCGKKFCEVFLSTKHLKECSFCKEKVCPSLRNEHFIGCNVHKDLVLCKKNMASHYFMCAVCKGYYCNSVKHFVIHPPCGGEYCPVKGHSCPNGDEVPPSDIDPVPVPDGNKDCENDYKNCSLSKCSLLRKGVEICGCLAYCGVVICRTHRPDHTCLTHLHILACPRRSDCLPSRCAVCGGSLCLGYGAHLPSKHDHSTSDAPPGDNTPVQPLPEIGDFTFPEFKFFTILKSKIIPDLIFEFLPGENYVFIFNIPFFGDTITLDGCSPSFAAKSLLDFLRLMINLLSRGVMSVLFCLACWKYINK
ncbi:MAG: hypothetical protein RR335_11265, partial [Eubacterium sp.]